MSGGGWAVFSFVSAMFTAGIFLVNQYSRLPGDILVFWMRLGVAVAALPLAFFIPWPDSPAFYVAVGVTVLLAVPADVRLMNVCAKYGGGVASRLKSLIVWMSFFLWFAFDPALPGQYAAHPVNTAVIFAALGGCVFFASRQNRCEINRAAFIHILPALAAYAVTVVLNKYAMLQGVPAGTVYGYIVLQPAMSVPLLALLILRRARREGGVRWTAPGAGRAAALFSACWIGAMIFKNYAMVYVPNPAYTAAIGLSAPLFVALFYLLVKHREEGDVKNGMGVVACAVLLALATIR